MTLDFMPSPSREDPGLFIRDPYRFSDAMLIVPPPLVECLECFDGRHSDLDLRAALARITGRLETEEISRHLVDTLANAGFLEDEIFARMQSEKRREFAEKPVREPSHAGSAYPADPRSCGRPWRSTWRMAMDASGIVPADGLFAIAAPHVSPSGGWQSYQAAYRMLRPEHRDRTFVILATSHYGAPEKFGLTRKKFRTPLGESETDTASGGLAGGAWRQRHRNGGLLPLLRAHRGAADDFPAAFDGRQREGAADPCAGPTRTASIAAASPRITTA
jgi:MEMO1 family protein